MDQFSSMKKNGQDPGSGGLAREREKREGALCTDFLIFVVASSKVSDELSKQNFANLDKLKAAFMPKTGLNKKSIILMSYNLMASAKPGSIDNYCHDFKHP